MKIVKKVLVTSLLLLNVTWGQSQEITPSASSTVLSANNNDTDKQFVIDFLESDPEGVISTIVAEIFDKGHYEDIYTDGLQYTMQHFMKKYHSNRIKFSKIHARVENDDLVLTMMYKPNNSDVESNVEYIISREKTNKQLAAALANVNTPHAIQQSIIMLLESDPDNLLIDALADVQEIGNRFSSVKVDTAFEFTVKKYERRVKFTRLSPIELNATKKDFIVTIYYKIDETGISDQATYTISRDEVMRRNKSDSASNNSFENTNNNENSRKNEITKNYIKTQMDKAITLSY